MICNFCNSAFYVYPYRAKTAKYCSKTCHDKARIGVPLSSERKDALKLAAKKRIMPPGIGKKISASKTGHTVSEETRNKISLAKTGQKHTEEAKRKIGAASKGNQYRKGRRHTEESKQKLSERARGNKFSLGKNKGKDNPNWRGGSAYLPYCSEFTKTLKESVRVAFERKCYLCGLPEKKNGRKLDVHHCDYNKGQGCGKKWNLVPLCHRCHAATSHNRHYYFNLLANYWATNVSINFSEEGDTWLIHW